MNIRTSTNMTTPTEIKVTAMPTNTAMSTATRTTMGEGKTTTATITAVTMMKKVTIIGLGDVLQGDHGATCYVLETEDHEKSSATVHPKAIRMFV